VQEQETLLISLSESLEVASNNMEATDEPVLGEDSKLEFPRQREKLELEAEKLEKKSTPGQFSYPSGMMGSLMIKKLFNPEPVS